MNNLQFTGDDFFADKDVCSIVLEVPNSDSWGQTGGTVGTHADRVRPTSWIQVDRGALPAQAVFLVGDRKRRLPGR